MSLVTAIIPCYNCEKWIGRAVNSVLAQSYPNIEILLIENNSTDNTFEILKTLEKDYPAKISVYVEKKKGAGAARNHGLIKAKGKWIQFLDADDELLPEKIAKQMAIVATHNPDIIIGDYTKIRSIKRGKNSAVEKITRQNIIAKDDLWAGLINSRLGITSANLWRKTSLLQVDGWNEELSSSQEYDMLFRLLKLKAKVIISHQLQTIVHAQSDSVSRTSNTDDDKQFKLYLNRYDLRRRIYEFLHENNLLTPNYKQDLYLYLYFHLLLISEVNLSYFKQHIKTFDFDQIGSLNKLKVFFEFLRHSTKRKFGQSKNKLLKLAEFQVFFFKYIYLLKF